MTTQFKITNTSQASEFGVGPTHLVELREIVANLDGLWRVSPLGPVVLNPGESSEGYVYTGRQFLVREVLASDVADEEDEDGEDSNSG